MASWLAALLGASRSAALASLVLPSFNVMPSTLPTPYLDAQIYDYTVTSPSLITQFNSIAAIAHLPFHLLAAQISLL
jgi:hypothetical protein